MFRQRGVGRLHHSRSNSRQSFVAMTTAERKPPSIYPIRPWCDLEGKIEGQKRKCTEREKYTVKGKNTNREQEFGLRGEICYAR